MNDDDDDDDIFSSIDQLDNGVYSVGGRQIFDLWSAMSQLNNSRASSKNATAASHDPATPAKRYDYKAMAETLMRELVANEIESHVLLKDDDIRDWWTGILKEEARKAEEARRREEARIKREKDKQLKADVLSRLTPDEKRVLGLK